jgi:hypothetical protein
MVVVKRLPIEARPDEPEDPAVEQKVNMFSKTPEEIMFKYDIHPTAHITSGNPLFQQCNTRKLNEQMKRKKKLVP